MIKKWIDTYLEIKCSGFLLRFCFEMICRLLGSKVNVPFIFNINELEQLRAKSRLGYV